MYDLLIKNGRLMDGSGVPEIRVDVALQDGRIADLGDLGRAGAKKTIDAAGLAVAPGFIDAHSHADFSVSACPAMDSALRQGVTTVIAGQCGISMAPLLEGTKDLVVDYLKIRKPPSPWEEWSDFGSYLDYLDRLAPACNIIPLVGQGVIRAGVMGFSDRRPTQAELGEMACQAALAMDAGAWGISTGLIYPPGVYSRTDELIEVTRPVGKRDGFYFSHIRDEGDQLLESIREALTIGREAGAKVQISHLKAAWPRNWSKMKTALETIDQARAQGLDVAADMYPYTAAHTDLKAALPNWAYEGGNSATLERLAHGPARERMARDMTAHGFCASATWDRVMISRARNRPEYAGKMVSDLAAQAGKSGEEWVFDALIETDLDAGMIEFMMDEDNVRLGLAHPLVIIGSDSSVLPDSGPLAQGSTHPRGFGTFARVLGKYCRDDKLFSLEEGVSKMTGRTARRFGLVDRGLVKPGLAADLVVFDPDTVIDQARYGDSFHYPTGVEHVIVAGIPAILDGQPTGARSGRVLRRTGQAG